MARNWTKEQQQVIDLRNRNILVSAAAGSGKTAVLVERILKKVTDPRHPVDIDRLLVVTFTNAAAAEMRGRITETIEKAIEEDPNNENLQRQSLLVHNARICTIHSFCQYVISNYFAKIGLEPGFRVADENEAKLMKSDILDALLEEKYAEGEEEFLAFADGFSADKNDASLKEMILDVYESAMSDPYPEEWLTQAVMNYKMSFAEMEQTDWMQGLLELCKKEIAGIAEMFERLAESVSLQDESLVKLIGTLQMDASALDAMAEAASYTDLWQMISDFKFARISIDKAPEGTTKEAWKEYTDPIKNARDELKKKLTEGVKKKYFAQSPEEIEFHMQEAASDMEILAQCVRDFMAAFRTAKQQKTMMDFSDMEHYALQILRNSETKEPTDVALDFARYYDEIMIDEYQDSNLVQELLLTAVSKESLPGNEKGHNIFCVGDVKQSIYSFRRARPKLFNDKYKTYPTWADRSESAGDDCFGRQSLPKDEEDSCTKIELHANFRSFEEVLDDINNLCKPLIREDLGDIEYTDEVALHTGHTFDAYKNIEDNHTEVLLTDKGNDNEARMIAERICDLMNPSHPMQILDRGDGDQMIWRNIEYRDIVVLMRSTKAQAPRMIEVFKEYGIPATAQSSEGFFKSYEIRVLVALLQIIDNPRQDIPFAAVLHSPLVGLSAAEMAEIRSNQETPYHELVLHYCEDGSNEALREKLNAFLTKLESYRNRSTYLPMHDLLQYILDDTSYGELVLAMPAGWKRNANVSLLLEHAISYEKTAYRGLFHFVRYLSQMSRQEIDFGEAEVLGENENVVSFYTMHKSKGLEFPVVFVAGLGRMFVPEGKEKTSIHSDYGVGIEHVDEEKRLRYVTLLRQVINAKNTMEAKGEELRDLYVATTRAKQKLILTMALKDPEEAIEKYFVDEGPLSFTKRFGVNSFYQWILMSYALYGDKYQPKYVSEETLKQKQDGRIQGKGMLLKELLQDATEVSEERLKTLSDAMTLEYEFAAEAKIPAKVSVSSIKMDAIQKLEGREENGTATIGKKKEIKRYIPNFDDDYVEADSINQGALRGTAMHRVMECLDFRQDFSEESVLRQMDEMISSGRLTKEQRELVVLPKILAFGDTELCKRMSAAAKQGLLYEEQPFVMSLPARRVSSEYDSDQPVLVQGIIDAFFEEEDGLVLMDYKTDRFDKAQDFIDHYRVQLELYAHALNAAGGKQVKDIMIYSFRLGEEIRIPMK